MPENDKPTRTIKIQNLQEELKHIVNISLRIQLLSLLASYDPNDMDTTLEVNETDIVEIISKRKEPRYMNQQAETEIADNQEGEREYPVFLTLKAGIDIISEYATQNNDNTYTAFFIGIRRAKLTDEQVHVLYIPTLAVFYYLALHPEIDPRGAGIFDVDENKAGLLEVFAQMDTFYKANRDFLQDEQAFLTAFLEHANPKDAEKLIKVVTRKIDSLDYPIDKVNSNIWGLLGEMPKNGQIALHMEKRGSKTPVLTLYSIDFSKVEELIEASGGKITRKLSQYDKRVCTAAASLYNSGQSVFSFTRLYEAMGNTGRPGKSDFDKLEAAIKKLEGAIIMLDNKAEVDAGYKYPKFKYYGSLMPLEFVKAEIDGVTVDAAIRLFREPPVISFARQRKQFTTVALKMLQSPVSKTENTLAIEDYLIEYISRAKDERKSCKEALNKLQRVKVENRTDKDEQRIDELKEELKKPIRILISTIFEKANIPRGGIQQRAKDTIIPALLNHYKANGFITSYTSDKKGYSVTV